MTKPVTSGPTFDLMVALKKAIDDSIDRDSIDMEDALCALGNIAAYVLKDAPSSLAPCLEYMCETALKRLAHDHAMMHEGTGTIQ